MVNNEVNIARRLASQTWGKVVKQRKLLEGVWEFDCERHGGIVVDVRRYPMFGKPETVYISGNSNQYRPTEQHFKAFEEDLEVNIVIYHLPEIVSKLEKRYNWKKSKTVDQWCHDVLVTAQQVVKRDYPEYIKNR